MKLFTRPFMKRTGIFLRPFGAVSFGELIMMVYLNQLRNVLLEAFIYPFGVYFLAMGRRFLLFLLF